MRWKESASIVDTGRLFGRASRSWLFSGALALSALTSTVGCTPTIQAHWLYSAMDGSPRWDLRLVNTSGKEVAIEALTVHGFLFSSSDEPKPKYWRYKESGGRLLLPAGAAKLVPLTDFRVEPCALPDAVTGNNVEIALGPRPLALPRYIIKSCMRPKKASGT